MSRKQLLVYLVAFIVSTVVVVSLFIASFFSKEPSTQIIDLSPSPTAPLRGVGSFPSLPPQAVDLPAATAHPNGTYLQQTITPADQKIIQQDYLVGQLIKKLPFHSELFVLRYDIETNSFVVSFIKDKLNEANQSFDKFLKDNSIENRNWLYNLNTKNQTY